MSPLSFLLLTFALVYAGPLRRDSGKTTLAITARFNAAGVSGFVERERSRLQSLMLGSRPGRRSTGNGSVSVSNSVLYYTTEVGIGTPPAYYTLAVDTGSSNTWVGISQAYVPTSSSVDTGNTFSVSYGSGHVSGEEWLDTVTLSSSLVITNQSIGAASSTQGTFNFDGILGLGPADLAQGTVSNTQEVPTVTQNLYDQKNISQEEVGIFFAPLSGSNSDGTLTFGGYDDSVITSLVNYVPVTTTPSATYYWGINQSISYGTTTILSTTAGIVDSGTTLVYLSSDAFQIYQSATGAVFDPNTGFLAITSAQYDNLQTLSFDIGGTTYGLTPNAQIWPRSLNSAINGNSSAIYLVAADLGTPTGSGFDFVNGYVFLERFYSVFDTAGGRVGFAETIYTSSTTN